MKTSNHNRALRIAMLEKMSALATAGFGLVAALAWNDAIQSLFKRIFPQSGGLTAKFIYAIIVTVIVVVITTKLGRMIGELTKEGKKEDIS